MDFTGLELAAIHTAILNDIDQLLADFDQGADTPEAEDHFINALDLEANIARKIEDHQAVTGPKIQDYEDRLIPIIGG